MHDAPQPTPPTRSDAEAHALLTEELDRLAPRRSALGEAGSFAVAGWTLQMAMEFEASALAWARAHELDPRQVEAVFNEGLCRLELGDWETAATRFRRALELDAELRDDPEAEPLDWEEQDPAYRLGNALHAAGDLDAAIPAYEQSAVRNMMGIEALRELVRCHLAREDGARALEALERMERRAGRLSVRAEILALRGEAKRLLSEADGGGA